MSYEPGSPQCRALIAAKENILSAIRSLRDIEGIDHIHSQLRGMYKELDEIHEGRMELENES